MAQQQACRRVLSCWCWAACALTCLLAVWYLVPGLVSTPAPDPAVVGTPDDIDDVLSSRRLPSQPAVAACIDVLPPLACRRQMQTNLCADRNHRYFGQCNATCGQCGSAFVIGDVGASRHSSAVDNATAGTPPRLSVPAPPLVPSATATAEECKWGLGTVALQPPNDDFGVALPGEWCRCNSPLAYCIGPRCEWTRSGGTTWFEAGSVCPDCGCWFEPSNGGGDVLRGSVMRELLKRFLPPTKHLDQLGLLAVPPGQLIRTVLLPSAESPRHNHIRSAALARGYDVAFANEAVASSSMHTYPRWLGFYGCVDGVASTELPDAVHAIVEVQGETLAGTATQSIHQRSCYAQLLVGLMTRQFRIETLAASNPTLAGEMGNANDPLFTNRLPMVSLQQSVERYLHRLAGVTGSVLLYATQGSTHAFPVNSLYARKNSWSRFSFAGHKQKHEPWDPHTPKLPSGTMGWLPHGCKGAKCPNVIDTPLPGGGSNVLVLVLKHTSHTQLELMLPRLNLALDANRSAIDLSAWYAATQGSEPSPARHNFDAAGNFKLPQHLQDKATGSDVVQIVLSNDCSQRSHPEHRNNSNFDIRVAQRTICGEDHKDRVTSGIAMLNLTVAKLVELHERRARWFAILNLANGDTDVPAAIAPLDGDLAALVTLPIIGMASVVVVSGGGILRGPYALTPAAQAEHHQAVLKLAFPNTRDYTQQAVPTAGTQCAIPVRPVERATHVHAALDFELQSGRSVGKDPNVTWLAWEGQQGTRVATVRFHSGASRQQGRGSTLLGDLLEPMMFARVDEVCKLVKPPETRPQAARTAAPSALTFTPVGIAIGGGRCVAARELPSEESYYADADIRRYSPLIQMNASCPGTMMNKFSTSAGPLPKQPAFFSSIVGREIIINKKALHGKIDQRGQNCQPMCWWNTPCADNTSYVSSQGWTCSDIKKSGCPADTARPVPRGVKAEWREAQQAADVRAQCQQTCGTCGTWGKMEQAAMLAAWHPCLKASAVPPAATAAMVACGDWVDIHALHAAAPSTVANSSADGDDTGEWTAPPAPRPSVGALPNKPSILVIELDSVSRSAMRRFMPQTLKFLRHSELLVTHTHSEHTFHTSVGPNSLANQIPMLSGCVLADREEDPPEGFTKHLPLRNKSGIRAMSYMCYEPDEAAKPSDRWLHNIAHANGYTTALLEEFCYMDSPFVPQANFFDDSTVDHLEAGALFCALKRRPKNVELGSWVCFDKGMCDNRCLGSQSVQDVSLNQITTMWKAERTVTNKPLFAFYNSAVAHSYLQLPWRFERLTLFDTVLSTFLQSFLALPEAQHTMVVLMADHGMQEGSQLYNVGDQYGQMQPMLHILTPKTMPVVAKTLKRNGRALVTQFDLYATFRALLQGSTGSTGPERSRRANPIPWAHDLGAVVVPPTRTCSDAAIPPDFCGCENENYEVGSESTAYVFSPLRSRYGICNPLPKGIHRAGLSYCAHKPEHTATTAAAAAIARHQRRLSEP